MSDENIECSKMELSKNYKVGDNTVHGGKCIAEITIVVSKEKFDEMRVMPTYKLAEGYGRKDVLKMLQKAIDFEMRFDIGLEKIKDG
ncbi:MAG: hypothetical protein HZC29_06975 [Thaumarchaeota archaeon]|nr:hypothetical protein [Nitrososphaerota archaeon]